MKIIVAGNGKMGMILSRQLCAEGYDVTLIDTNLRVLEEAQERYDVMVVQGNCATMQVLEQAGVKDAKLLIAMTGADEINLLCCMTAHGMNGQIHTIARIRNPEYADQIYKMRNMFALSMAVNPEKQAAIEIERLLKFPGFLKRETFARGRVEIVELKIDADSKLCNVSMSEIGNIVKCKVLVCAVLRDGTAVAPDGRFVLKENDRIFVTAPTNELATLLHNLGIVTHKVKRALICGGGRVSVYLARQLQKSGISLQIIEQDHDMCVQLASSLPWVDIVEGDASNEFMLESVGISKHDALITATGIDELNMVVSLYGANCGVPQIITKLGRIENNSILNHLSLGSTISPRELCSNAIVRYVRAMKKQTGAAAAIHSIADNQAEAIEFVVGEDTKHCNEPLRKIKLKKNTLIACITHGNNTEIPSGDSFFEKGDIIIVVTGKEKVIYQLNDVFEE